MNLGHTSYVNPHDEERIVIPSEEKQKEFQNMAKESERKQMMESTNMNSGFMDVMTKTQDEYKRNHPYEKSEYRTEHNSL